ncbi:craniofacial development protein 2-like [Cylas formicarius]|uniref:craniofacial development protein 2-like n=1 Tax=Cylas formicarius TaxID=197179 RepID=UPI00295833B0|nr:craniofacial development protein 2-like [Cylas formicarius]
MTGKAKVTALSPRQTFDGQGVLRISGPVMRRIATWNARSMFEAGKVHNAIKEMRRLNIEILGISEMRWPRSGQVQIEGHQVLYAGNDDRNHYNGVGIIVNEEVKGAIKAFAPISDRVILLQLNAHPFNVNIIQTYAPTCDHSDEEVELFYMHLDSAMELVNKSDVTIVMGDFNAKVGNRPREGIVGEYGLGVPNERGDRLVQFCQERELVITNTFFKLPSRRLYTWRSNAETLDRIVRSQIDLNSDHNPVIVSVRINLKKLKTKTKTRMIDTSKLNNEELRTEVKEMLNEKLLNTSTREEDIETSWNVIKHALVETSKAKLKTETRRTDG